MNLAIKTWIDNGLYKYKYNTTTGKLPNEVADLRTSWIHEPFFGGPTYYYYTTHAPRPQPPPSPGTPQRIGTCGYVRVRVVKPDVKFSCFSVMLVMCSAVICHQFF